MMVVDVCRIPWDVFVPNNNEISVVQEGDEWNYSSNNNAEDNNADDKEDDEGNEDDEEEGSDDDDEGDDDDDDDDEESVHHHNPYAPNPNQELPKNVKERRCDLLWQGIIPKRMFVGFKFQESKTSHAARKMLEGKNATHYWDFVTNADSIIASANSVDLF